MVFVRYYLILQNNRLSTIFRVFLCNTSRIPVKSLSRSGEKDLAFFIEYGYIQVTLPEIDGYAMIIFEERMIHGNG